MNGKKTREKDSFKSCLGSTHDEKLNGALSSTQTKLNSIKQKALSLVFTRNEL